MRLRRISKSDVAHVLSDPQLTRPGDKPGRTVYERNIGRVVCVVIVEDTDPTIVVTVFSRD